MSEISYRWAVPGDIEALVNLRLEFLAEGGQGGGEATGLPQAVRAYFSTMLPRGDFVAALAEADGIIVGVSGMVYDRHPPRLKNPSGIQPYIMNVYVRSAYRGRGIATELLKMLIGKARASGSKLITLHFWPGKSALYAKVGFVPTEAEMKLEL